MLKLTLQYTEEDLARGNRFILKRRLLAKKYLVVYFLLVGIGVLVFAFAQPVRDLRYTILSLGVVILLMLPGSFVLVRLMARQMAKQIFKNNPHVRHPQTYAFEEENLAITGELFDANLKWPVIVEAVETDSDFFLYLTKDQAYVLPKRVFKVGEDVLLRGFLKNKLQERAKFN
jgi:hypothetical protein